VFLAESAKGLITQFDVLKGNPVDEVHVAPSLRHHRRTFRRAPQLYGADRGFFSERNVTVCVRGGGCKTPQRATTNDRRRSSGASVPALRGASQC
jgi:IS5 family transposase